MKGLLESAKKKCMSSSKGQPPSSVSSATRRTNTPQRPPTPSQYVRISSAQERLPSQTPLRQQQQQQQHMTLTTISSGTGDTIRHVHPATPLRPPSSASRQSRARPSSGHSQSSRQSGADSMDEYLSLFYKLAKRISKQLTNDSGDRFSDPAIVERLVDIYRYMEASRNNNNATIKDHDYWVNDQLELLLDNDTTSDDSIKSDDDKITLLQDELVALTNQIENDSNQYQSSLSELTQQIAACKDQYEMMEQKFLDAEQEVARLNDELSALKRKEGTDVSIAPPVNGGNSSAFSDDTEETMGEDRAMESNTPSSGASLESSKVALQADPSTEDGVGRSSLDVPSTNGDEPDDGDATGSENGMVSNVRRAPTTTAKYRSPPHGAPPVHEVVCLSNSSRAQEVDDDSALSEAANTSMTLDRPRVRGGGDNELDSDSTIGDQTSQQDGLDGESENDLSEQDTDDDENSTKDTESDSSASSSSSISRSSNNDYEQQSSSNELDFGGNGMDDDVSSEEDHNASVTTTSQHDPDADESTNLVPPRTESDTKLLRNLPCVPSVLNCKRPGSAPCIGYSTYETPPTPNPNN